MIKNINNLVRYDFTSECRTCKYRKSLGVLEYCCSFVYDLIHKQKRLGLQKHILEYVLMEDGMEKINHENLLFSDDKEWTVTLKFKTNLHSHLILSEIEDLLVKSSYFKEVSCDY